MKLSFIRIIVLSFFVVFFSCFTTKKILLQHFMSLKSKDDIVVVIFGDSISGGEGSSYTSASYGKFLKPMLGDLFKSRISLINSCRQYESYRFAHRRIQEDILSYRPDIVFIMLGFVDAFTPGTLQKTHVKNIKKFYSILKKSETFVIILTVNGPRDLKLKNDQRVNILQNFNDILRDYSLYFQFPLIDVARYMENLRFSKPDEYRSLFSDNILLNEKGKKYIAHFIFQRITKILGKEI